MQPIAVLPSAEVKRYQHMTSSHQSSMLVAPIIRKV